VDSDDNPGTEHKGVFAGLFQLRLHHLWNPSGAEPLQKEILFHPGAPGPHLEPSKPHFRLPAHKVDQELVATDNDLAGVPCVPAGFVDDRPVPEPVLPC